MDNVIFSVVFLNFIKFLGVTLVHYIGFKCTMICHVYIAMCANRAKSNLLPSGVGNGGDCLKSIGFCLGR